MLYELLTQLRERTGLSVPDVATRLGVARPTAYQWEKAYSGRPEPEHLHALLELYCATDAEKLEAWRLRSLPRPAEGQVESAA